MFDRKGKEIYECYYKDEDTKEIETNRAKLNKNEVEFNPKIHKKENIIKKPMFNRDYSYCTKDNMQIAVHLDTNKKECYHKSESVFKDYKYFGIDTFRWCFRIHTNPPQELMNGEVFKVKENTGDVMVVGKRDGSGNPCVLKYLIGDKTLSSDIILPNIKAIYINLDIPTIRGQPLSDGEQPVDHKSIWYGQAEIFFNNYQKSVCYYYHEEALKARGGLC